MTNSRGLIWKGEGDDSEEGSYRNPDQKEFAHVGALGFNTRDLAEVVKHISPTCIIGAVGVRPNCFNKEVIEAMVEVNQEKDQNNECTAGHERPIVFALSNPKTQAECTAKDAYTWSNGEVIFGSGTQFPPVEIAGRTHFPGQVNNVYIFPGMSFGAVQCKAKGIPDRFFMVAAEAVANSLNEEDLELDRVIPSRDRLREVALSVATAVVLEAQKTGLAGVTLGEGREAVMAALKAKMYTPTA